MTNRPITKAKSSIAAKLLRIIFAFYLILTACITGAQLFWEYRSANTQLVQSMREIGQGFLPSLQNAVWSLDDIELAKTIEGLLQPSEIVGVDVFDQNGERLAASGWVGTTGGSRFFKTDGSQADASARAHDFDSENLIVHSLSIEISEDDQQVVLGTAKLFSSETMVREGIQERFWTIILTTSLKIFALLCVLLYFSRRLVARPLGILNQATSRFDSSLASDQDDHLPDEIRSRSDELGVLAHSFEHMQRIVRAKVLNLVELNRSISAINKSRYPDDIIHLVMTKVVERIDVEYAEVVLYGTEKGIGPESMDNRYLALERFASDRDDFYSPLSELNFQDSIICKYSPLLLKGSQNVMQSRSRLLCHPELDFDFLSLSICTNDSMFALIWFKIPAEREFQLDDELLSFIEPIRQTASFSFQDLLYITTIDAQNRALEAKVEERTRELARTNQNIELMFAQIKQGIFTINTDQTINKEHSVFLQDIFETTDIAGKTLFDLLLKDSSLDKEVMFSIDSALSFMVGYQEFTFHLNHKVLPTKITKTFAGKEKDLELDWQPIVDEDGEIQSLMITIRDVTEIHKLQKQSEIQQKKLNMIAQILNIKVDKFYEFEKGAKRYLKNCRQLIGQTLADEEIVSQLFINIHTLKGFAKKYSLDSVVKQSFTAEQHLARLRGDQTIEFEWEPMIEMFRDIDGVITEYRSVIDEFVSDSNLNISDRFVKAAVEEFSVDDKSDTEKVEAFNHLHSVFIKEDEGTLEQIINESVDFVDDISRSLGLKTPQIAIDAAKEIALDDRERDILADILIHMLRNSLVHGYGRNDQPEINVRSYYADNGLIISYQDSGRGLNLRRLEEQGVNMGVLNERSTDREVAELIFESGVSTHNKVDDMAGQGVGMPAIRSFIESVDGSVRIDFVHPRNRSGFRKFRFLLLFPRQQLTQKSA